MQVENSLIFSPRNQHYIPSRVPEGYTSGNTWDPWLVGEEGRESKKKGEMPLCVSTYKLFFFFFLPISFYLQSFLPLIPLLLQFSSRNIEIHCPRCHVQFSSVQFSCSVVSDSLWPHESQHARPPCPSPTPWVYSNSCPSSRWCHPATSSSVVPFSSCPPIPPSIRVFSNESTLHVRWPKY